MGGEFDHIAAAMRDSPLIRAFTEMAVSGDFSRLDKNMAKRQHFVPRFLLRGFSQVHDGKDVLFQMEAHSRRAPRRVGIRQAASRHKLYTALDENGNPSNRNEGYLALVEEHAAPALRRLLDDPTSLSRRDRATITFFVAVQTMRTPTAAEQMTMIANAALQTAASERYSDRRGYVENHREHFGQGATDDEIERSRQEILDLVRSGEIQLNGENGAAFSMGLRHAVEQVPMLFEFDWTLLRAPGGGFIVSDGAYSIHDPTPPYPWAAQAILSSQNSETILPLSDTACLLLRPAPTTGGLTVRETSARELETVNLRTYGWADTYVFGKTQEALVAVRKATRKRPADVVRPKPFVQVALLEPDPDDQSLAKENIRRGWPAQLSNGAGELRDYVVIPSDNPHPERWKQIDELTEQRARKRAGVGQDDQVNVRITNRPVHPHDISDG